MVNKIDLYMILKFLSNLKKYNPFLISVLKETNIDKVISEIQIHFKKSLHSNTDIFITRERHRIDLNNCILLYKILKTKI